MQPRHTFPESGDISIPLVIGVAACLATVLRTNIFIPRCPHTTPWASGRFRFKGIGHDSEHLNHNFLIARLRYDSKTTKITTCYDRIIYILFKRLYLNAYSLRLQLRLQSHPMKMSGGNAHPYFLPAATKLHDPTIWHRRLIAKFVHPLSQHVPPGIQHLPQNPSHEKTMTKNSDDFLRSGKSTIQRLLHPHGKFPIRLQLRAFPEVWIAPIPKNLLPGQPFRLGGAIIFSRLKIRKLLHRPFLHRDIWVFIQIRLGRFPRPAIR